MAVVITPVSYTHLDVYKRQAVTHEDGLGIKARLLGIDLGLKRVGISISDDLGRFAHPLDVYKRQIVEFAKGK